MTVPGTSPEAERVRHLVRLDARQIIERLDARYETMVHYFSALRDRESLLAPVQSLLPTLRFGDLVVLEPSEQEAVLTFARVVEELRWYLRYTEHMPGTLSEALKSYRQELHLAFESLLESLAPSAFVRPPEGAAIPPPPPRAAPAPPATKKVAAKKVAAKKVAAKKVAAKKTATKTIESERIAAKKVAAKKIAAQKKKAAPKKAGSKKKSNDSL